MTDGPQRRARPVVLANIDFERRLLERVRTRVAPREPFDLSDLNRRPAAELPRLPTLPARVRQMHLAVATATRIFALPGETVELPHRPSPTAHPEPAEPLRPIDEVRFSAPAPERTVIAFWAHPVGRRLHPRPSWSASDSLPRNPIAAAIRRAPRPSLDAVLRCHSRPFCQELAAGLGLALESSGVARGADALRSLLEDRCGRVQPAFLPDRGWVLKLPYGVAGRHRIRFRHPSQIPHRIWRDPALELGVVLEPWMDRRQDHGFTALLAADGRIEHPRFHRSSNRSDGSVHGVELLDPDTTGPTRKRFSEVLPVIAERLHTAGFRGPFGIDFWSWIDERGRPRLHLLGEINARWTLGWIARAWEASQRFRSELGPAEDAPATGVRNPVLSIVSDRTVPSEGAGIEISHPDLEGGVRLVLHRDRTTGPDRVSAPENGPSTGPDASSAEQDQKRAKES